MPNDNTRLTDYETKEKLEKLKDDVGPVKDPLEPQWDYDGENRATGKHYVKPSINTHWPKCWMVHLECSIKLIGEMQRDLAEMHATADANANEALDY